MMTARPKWCTEEQKTGFLLTLGTLDDSKVNSMSIYQSLSLQTLFLWPQTAGWLLCHSHMPEQNRQETQAQWDMKYIHTFTRGYIILLDRVSDLLVFFQGHARLCSIWSFNENQLIFLDILQDALRKHVQRSVSQGTTLCGGCATHFSSLHNKHETQATSENPNW